MTSRLWSIALLAVMALAGLLLTSFPRPDAAPRAAAEAPAAPLPATPASPPLAPLPDAQGLPEEAWATIALIRRGGPYPHRQDGTVFGNRERLLPRKPHGYYREFTVATPGLSHRGARRIVTGGQPPAVWYYTDDHYRSFRAFTP